MNRPTTTAGVVLAPMTVHIRPKPIWKVPNKKPSNKLYLDIKIISVIKNEKIIVIKPPQKRAGTKSSFEYFLINRTNNEKWIGISKATRFPNKDPSTKEPPIITKIPIIAKIIARSVFKLIFSLRNK